MQNYNYFMGQDGYVWWQGVVEDRLDPLKLGRCRVRVLGYHSEDKEQIPTEDLPWAYPAMPINNRPNGIPVGPVEGTWVLGFFRDGEHAQEPIMTHIIDYGETVTPEVGKAFNDPGTNSEKPKRPYELKEGEINTNRLARGETADTLIDKRKNEVDSIPIGGGGSQDEPGSPYAAEFPYNYVEESESGHLIEIDDTPTAERVNITHKDGNFIEMHPGGDQVVKVQGDQYTVVIKDNYLYVKGNLNISTDSDMAEYVGGDHVSQILGDEEINILGKKTETISGDDTLKVRRSKTDNITSSYKLSARGVTIDSKINVTVKGKIIKLN